MGGTLPLPSFARRPSTMNSCFPAKGPQNYMAVQQKAPNRGASFFQLVTNTFSSFNATQAIATLNHRSCLNFLMSGGSRHERTTFQENTFFAWSERLFTQRVKYRLVDQNQGLMEYLLQWLAQIVRVAQLTQALGARTNLLMYAVLARTRSSFSEQSG